MHRKTDSRDSVFTTIGLAMLKSTLRLAALLLLAVSANAQTSRGTVTGTVLDPTGAVIAGASVTLTGVETGVRLFTNSNDAGIYRFDAVDPGNALADPLRAPLGESLGHGFPLPRIWRARRSFSRRIRDSTATSRRP